MRAWKIHPYMRHSSCGGERVKINGETKLTGIIGHPLTYTISPAMHNAVFERLGLNFAYVPLVVQPDAIFGALEGLRALGFVGVNVTMPFKEAVLPFMDDVASYAQMVGAVNTIHVRDGRLVGYNTDGRGFIASLENDSGFEPAGKRVVILGAGGGARSVAASLCLAKVASVTVVNRTMDRAEALVEMIATRFADCSAQVLAMDDAAVAKAVSQSDLVVNAVPAGVDEDVPVPDAIQSVGKKQLVFDLVYKPEESPVLAAARKKGAACQNGLGMLVYQGASAFEIFTGRSAPPEVMLEAAREALADDGDGEEENGSEGEQDELAGLLDSAGSEG